MRANEGESGSSGEEVEETVAVPADRQSSTCPPDTLIESLYRLYRRPLLLHALSFTGDLQTAEDACHTVFLRLLQREDRPSEITLGYLRTAVRHACFDHQKRVRRLTPLPPDLDPPLPPADDPDTDASDQQIVSRLLDLLPEKARTIVDLWLDQMSYRDIAEKLGIPSKTVDTILTRARARLRALLLAKRERERERESRGDRYGSLRDPLDGGTRRHELTRLVGHVGEPRRKWNAFAV